MKRITVEPAQLELFARKMDDLNGVHTFRKCTFDSDNKITALQQGPDTSDLKNQKYQGDSHVLVDKAIIFRTEYI